MLKIKFFIIITGLVIPITLQGQEIIRSVIGAAGSSSHNNGLLIIQTIGQPPGTRVLSDNSGVLRQGFQQPIDHPSVTYAPVAEIYNPHINDFFILYPNPANEIVNIEITVDKGLEWGIQITNVYGKTVYIRNGLTDSQATINLASLNSGIYFITLVSGSERSTRKLVIL